MRPSELRVGWAGVVVAAWGGHFACLARQRLSTLPTLAPSDAHLVQLLPPVKHTLNRLMQNDLQAQRRGERGGLA